MLDADLPNLVQMDVSPLAGRLAERLLKRTPWLDKAFFANSGAEAVEASIKFAAPRRAGRASCIARTPSTGLSYGPLSAAGDKLYRDGFGPLLPEFRAIPFDDLTALERSLRGRDVAAFLVEPIQGKVVRPPSPRLSARGAGFVPQIRDFVHRRRNPVRPRPHRAVSSPSSISAPSPTWFCSPRGCRAAMSRRRRADAAGNVRQDLRPHGPRGGAWLDFRKNDLAMAAGLATLDVIESEKLIENAAARGERLNGFLRGLMGEVEYIKDVRGLGLMLGGRTGRAEIAEAAAFWGMLETVSKGLTCQLVTIPLFKDQKGLCRWPATAAAR